jgi:hypothetical protein
MSRKMTGFDSKNANNILWKPHYKQALAMACAAFEMLFGGAAGGGKSDFLLMDFYANAVRYAKRCRGILFRRTYDELGNYPTDFAWRYMISRCRSAEGAPCFMRGSANPGGPGHAWIKQRFIDGYAPGKVHRVTDEGGAATTRAFIPSRLEDNPTLMRNDPGYADRLRLLPGHLYRALRQGDWDIFAGQVFDEWRRDAHLVRPFALPQGGWRRFYAIDWGYATPYAIAKLAVDGDGKVFMYGERYGCALGEMNKGTKESSPEVAARAWRDAVSEGVTDLVGDPSMWNKRDGYPAPITAFQDAGFRCHPANNDRAAGLVIVHNFMKEKDENGQPMFQVFESCPHTARTLPVLTPDPCNMEDVDTRLEDHLYDAIRYGLTSRFASRPRAGGQQPPRRAARRGYDPLDDWGAA